MKSDDNDDLEPLIIELTFGVNLFTWFKGLKDKKCTKKLNRPFFYYSIIDNNNNNRKVEQ